MDVLAPPVSQSGRRPPRITADHVLIGRTAATQRATSPRCAACHPTGATDHFHAAYRPTPDAAIMRRARGWAMWPALGGILVGDAGVHGRPGGKPAWGPPAPAALRRLIAATT